MKKKIVLVLAIGVSFSPSVFASSSNRVDQKTGQMTLSAIDGHPGMVRCGSEKGVAGAPESDIKAKPVVHASGLK